jgi:YGGT family
MAIDTVDQTVTTQEPRTDAGRESVRTDSHHMSSTTPGGSEMTRRIVVLAFGLVQIVIGLRFVLLLLDAREANGLVSGIINLSQVFVAPFQGILRTDALHSTGSTFDVTAVVAFIGWTILELVVIWAVGIFRRRQIA